MGLRLEQLNRSRDVIRWMGARIAVYDLCSPREADTSGRKIVANSRRRKRGCRSSRGDRQRRSLTRAARTSRQPPPVKSSSLARRSKSYERYIQWSARSIKRQSALVRRVSSYRSSLFPTGPMRKFSTLPPEIRKKLRASLQRCEDRLKGYEARWLDATVAQSGDSRAFAVMRRKILLMTDDELDDATGHWLDQVEMRRSLLSSWEELGWKEELKRCLTVAFPAPPQQRQPLPVPKLGNRSRPRRKPKGQCVNFGRPCPGCPPCTAYRKWKESQS